MSTAQDFPLKNSNNSEDSNICSRYAVYIFSTNKHASDGNKDEKSSRRYDSKSSDVDEPNICLSLLDGNLGAKQETVVRCYLLKTLSAKEDLSFENEGKFVTLKFSDESSSDFGCYYHRLSKEIGTIENSDPSCTKKYTFFICLIGTSDNKMDIFCPELGVFCYKLLPLLDPEGIKNQDDVQQRLRKWYYYSVGYIERCFVAFKDDIILLLQMSLWGNVLLTCDDENVKWDLERLIETCSLMPSLLNNYTNSETENHIHLKVVGGRLKTENKISNSSYCEKWVEKLSLCEPTDHAGLKSILESFRLKTIQELNSLKRLLKKAETDHYSLYRAYQFLQNSGYDDILLHHVKQEAVMAESKGALKVINCLIKYIQIKEVLPKTDIQTPSC